VDDRQTQIGVCSIGLIEGFGAGSSVGANHHVMLKAGLSVGLEDLLSAERYSDIVAGGRGRRRNRNICDLAKNAVLKRTRHRICVNKLGT
jgi:hypothetical protein